MSGLSICCKCKKPKRYCQCNSKEVGLAEESNERYPIHDKRFSGATSWHSPRTTELSPRISSKTFPVQSRPKLQLCAPCPTRRISRPSKPLYYTRPSTPSEDVRQPRATPTVNASGHYNQFAVELTRNAANFQTGLAGLLQSINSRENLSSPPPPQIQICGRQSYVHIQTTQPTSIKEQKNVCRPCPRGTSTPGKVATKISQSSTEIAWICPTGENKVQAETSKQDCKILGRKRDQCYEDRARERTCDIWKDKDKLSNVQM